jgi:hypothetical protein
MVEGPKPIIYGWSGKPILIGGEAPLHDGRGRLIGIGNKPILRDGRDQPIAAGGLPVITDNNTQTSEVVGGLPVTQSRTGEPNAVTGLIGTTPIPPTEPTSRHIPTRETPPREEPRGDFRPNLFRQWANYEHAECDAHGARAHMDAHRGGKNAGDEEAKRQHDSARFVLIQALNAQVSFLNNPPKDS